MQESIIRFFQELSTPFLDTVFEILTMFGEQEVFIAVICLIFWNISRRKGMILGLTLSLSVILNLSLKLIIRSPRPYLVLEGVAGKRLATAGGYAFPSGHTQGAATFYAGLAYIVRKRWFTAAALIISLAVGISRLYLGVHWPIDVAGGYLLGLAAAALLYRRLLKLVQDNPEHIRRAWFAASLFFALAAFAAALFDIFGAGDPDFDMIKGMALFSGLLLGSYMAEYFLRFSCGGALSKKTLRFIVGLATSLLILAGGKLVLPDGALSAFLRYELTAVWAFAIYPRLGLAIGLFTRE